MEIIIYVARVIYHCSKRYAQETRRICKKWIRKEWIHNGIKSPPSASRKVASYSPSCKPSSKCPHRSSTRWPPQNFPVLHSPQDGMFHLVTRNMNMGNCTLRTTIEEFPSHNKPVMEIPGWFWHLKIITLKIKRRGESGEEQSQNRQFLDGAPAMSALLPLFFPALIEARFCGVIMCLENSRRPRHASYEATSLWLKRWSISLCYL